MAGPAPTPASYPASDEEIDVFVEAAGKGDIPWVAEFLTMHRASINRENSRGRTALMAAAASGHESMISLLISLGADVNAQAGRQRPCDRDQLGRTAMMFACQPGWTGSIALLLRQGADPELEDNDGWTALTYAARRAYRNIVELLMDHGADIHHKRKGGGRTDMQWAIDHNEEKLIDALRRQGPGGPGLTPLIHARCKGLDEIAELMERRQAEKEQKAAVQAHVDAQQARLRELARRNKFKISPG